MNKFSEFVEGFVPKNVSKKRRAELKMELENHLYDKSDYYKEIGFSEEESIEKALEDFGTDEKMRDSIFNEFEELYSEKTVFSIISFIGTLLMNIICTYTGVWVITADFIGHSTPLKAFVSFLVIFVVLGLIAFARIKKYRKMLFGVGIANVLILISLIANVYAQCAIESVTYNVVYLIDVLTPISLGDFIYGIGYDLIFRILIYTFPIFLALYCFITSVRLKKGVAKELKNTKKKAVIFSSLFFAFAIFNCLLLPTSLDYEKEYKAWFDENFNNITDKSEFVFESIQLGESYSEASNKLVTEGFISIEAFEESLEKIRKKPFRYSVEKFDFEDGYEIWFEYEDIPTGNGFVGIKQENGIITAKAVGNIEKEMYRDRMHDANGFGSGFVKEIDDITIVKDYFEKLKKGDKEVDVIKFFTDNGTFYSKRFYAENGVEKHYYRVEVEEYIVNAYPSNPLEEKYYIELTFENGSLANGALYKVVYENDKEKVVTEEMN